MSSFFSGPLGKGFGRLLEVALGNALESPLEAGLSRSAAQLLNLAATAQGVWAEARDLGKETRAYLGSAALEKSLDALAARLGIHFERFDKTARSSFRLRHRRERIRVKAAWLAESSGARLLAAFGIGGAIGAISRKPQVMLGAGLLCGGIQAASLAWETADSFGGVPVST